MNARAFVLFVVVAACKTSPVVTTPAPDPIECDSPRLYTDLADACSESEPELAEALRAVSRDTTLRRPPTGSEHWRAADRKSFTLYQASYARLPAECTADFNAKNYPVDDYGRAVREVSHRWEADARCRPFDMQEGTIDVGVWSLATVLAPRLDAAGKARLRKLLVCEER